MEQVYYIFDGKSRQWIECLDPWVRDDIEEFGITIITDQMSNGSTGENKAGKSGKSLLAYADVQDFSNRYSCIYKKAAARWRIQLYKPQKTAIVLVDVFTVMASREGVQLHTRGSKQYSLRLDYGKWQYSAIPSKLDQVESSGSFFNYKYDWTDEGFDFSVEIPRIVVDRVMTFLKECSQEEFGFTPSVPGNIPGARLLKYFTLYPLDANVGWYVDMLGYDFARQVTRSNDTNFSLICDYLKLPKSKGLQRAYRENGRVLLLCFFLMKIGIQDQNLWPVFFDLQVLMGNGLDRYGIDRSGNLYRRQGSTLWYWWGGIDVYQINYWWQEQSEEIKQEYDPRYVGWQLLVKWLFEKWEPHRCAEILRDALKCDSYQVVDCLRMWFQSYTKDELNREFIQGIYRTGFSEETHNLWMAEVRRQQAALNEGYRRSNEAKKKDYMNIEFVLTKGDLMKEEDTPQGRFKVARSGRELFELSEKFHNCVFYLYTEKMQRRDCIIYYLEKEGAPVACIEVAKGIITQALGDHNHILTSEIKDAVIDWGIRHNLEFKPDR